MATITGVLRVIFLIMGDCPSQHCCVDMEWAMNIGVQ